MKKLSYSMVLLAILGIFVFSCERSHNPIAVTDLEKAASNGPISLAKTICADFQVVTLYAGQHIDVGTVSVWNDEDNLYVTYNTTGEWCLTETHLHVATSLDEIPQTKKGNPIPGQFDYGTEHDPCVTEYTYIIPLEWSTYTDLYIAAHAVVCEQGQEETETAWADGEDFPGNNWATYFTYRVQPCYKDVDLPEDPVTMRVYHPYYYPGGSSYFKHVLSNVPGGYDVTNGTYVGWCVDQYVYIYVGRTYYPTLRSSYDPDLPDYAQDPDWDKVNYILNNKHPNATYMDIQRAIWYFIDGGHYPSDPEAKAMVDDANANGDGYRPQSGQVIAVLCLLGERIQLTFFEVDP